MDAGDVQEVAKKAAAEAILMSTLLNGRWMTGYSVRSRRRFNAD
jgi:hypothetical protein